MLCTTLTANNLFHVGKLELAQQVLKTQDLKGIEDLKDYN